MCLTLYRFAPSFPQRFDYTRTKEACLETSGLKLSVRVRSAQVSVVKNANVRAMSVGVSFMEGPVHSKLLACFSIHPAFQAISDKAPNNG